LLPEFDLGNSFIFRVKNLYIWNDGNNWLYYNAITIKPGYLSKPTFHLAPLPGSNGYSRGKHSCFFLVSNNLLSFVQLQEIKKTSNRTTTTPRTGKFFLSLLTPKL
jgi:hypothetical protein